MLCDLCVADVISEAVLEDARVKSCLAWLACDYDPDTPQPGEEDEDEGIDRLEDDAWYDSVYT